jgi:hypothetical protein
MRVCSSATPLSSQRPVPNTSPYTGNGTKLANANSVLDLIWDLKLAAGTPSLQATSLLLARHLPDFLAVRLRLAQYFYPLSYLSCVLLLDDTHLATWWRHRIRFLFEGLSRQGDSFWGTSRNSSEIRCEEFQPA